MTFLNPRWKVPVVLLLMRALITQLPVTTSCQEWQCWTRDWRAALPCPALSEPLGGRCCQHLAQPLAPNLPTAPARAATYGFPPGMVESEEERVEALR